MKSYPIYFFSILLIFVTQSGCNKTSKANLEDDASGGVSGEEARRGVPGLDFPSGGTVGGGMGSGNSNGANNEGGGSGQGQQRAGGEGGSGEGNPMANGCTPTGPEQCDGIDNDCDGYEDEDQVCDILDYSLAPNHVCVLLANNRIKCWGDNLLGHKLGRGDNGLVNSNYGDEPGEMNEGLLYVDLEGFIPVDVESGLDHNCVRSAEGRIKCWGVNGHGELGYEHDASIGRDPRTLGMNLLEVALGVDENGDPFEVTALSLGEDFSCASLVAPTEAQPDLQRIKCWGNNSVSQLGQGTGCPGCTDENQVGDQRGEMGDNLVFTDFGTDENDFILSTSQMMAGNMFSCFTLTTGRAKCNGFSTVNVFGVTDPPRGWSGPRRSTGNDVHYVDLETGDAPDFIEDIQVGYAHSCALIRGGRVKCWGDNEHGQLGLGSTDSIEDDFEQIEFIDLGTDTAGEPLRVVQLAVGVNHNCVLLEGEGVSGKVKCWGMNGEGEMGIGFNANNDGMRFAAIGDRPDEMGNELRFVDLGDNAVVERIEASGSYSPNGAGYNCALLSDGDLKCWGVNDRGQLGQGDNRSIGDDEDEMGINLQVTEY